MKTILRLSVMIFIVGVGLFVCSHYLMELNSATTFSQVILKYHLFFMLWRYGLYATVLVLWSYFIKKWGAKQKWSTQVVDYLSHQRLKLLGFFVFIEVFFVHNALGCLISLKFN